MFASLTRETRESRRIAQPVLSFAIHAGLIALAAGQVPAPVPIGRPTGEPIFEPLVMVDHDAGRRTSEVGGDRGLPLPRPTCDCRFRPGPIPLELPVGTAVRIDHTDFLPDLRRSVLDSGQPIDSRVYREGDLSDAPVLVHFPDPIYPPALKAAGVEGAVQLSYVIDTKGHVEPESITIVSSDHPLMAESVRRALLEARFRPGRVQGNPVRSLVRQRIRFSLMSL